MLSPDQQRHYSTAIDQSLSSAQANLGVLAKRRLNAEERRTVAQIQNFIQQAQARRGSDPAAAKSLAERAEVRHTRLAAAA